MCSFLPLEGESGIRRDGKCSKLDVSFFTRCTRYGLKIKGRADWAVVLSNPQLVVLVVLYPVFGSF